MRRFITVLLLVGASVVLAAQHKMLRRPLVVLVTIPTSATRDGFVDPALKDSVRDLENALRKLNEFQLPGTHIQQHPDLVVTVLERGQGNTGGSAIFPVGSVLLDLPTEARWVKVQLTVPTTSYTHEFTGAGGLYTDAAVSVASQLQEWVKANAERLAHRQLAADTRDCEHVAAALAQAPGKTLAAKIRALHPRSYKNLNDERLEKIYLTEFPCLKNDRFSDK